MANMWSHIQMAKFAMRFGLMEISLQYKEKLIDVAKSEIILQDKTQNVNSFDD